MGKRKKESVRGKMRVQAKSVFASERHREAIEGLKMTFSEDTLLFSQTALTVAPADAETSHRATVMGVLGCGGCWPSVLKEVTLTPCMWSVLQLG